MHANRVRTVLEMLDHVTLMVSDGASKLSPVVVVVVFAALMTLTK